MKESGIGLTEVLIALLLSSLIMLALAQMYLGCKRQFQVTENRLAEAFDLQWISALLRDSIHQAGFTPCRSLDDLEHDQKQIPPALSIEEAPREGIATRRMAMHFNRVLEFQSASQLIVSNDVAIRLRQPLIIADCYHAEVAMPEVLRSSRQLQYVTLQKPLRYDYSGSAWLGEWIDEKWYIKRNRQKQKTFYYQEQHRSEELTSLVHTLTIRKHQTDHRPWISIVLGLEGKGEHELIVGMRNA